MKINHTTELESIAGKIADLNNELRVNTFFWLLFVCDAVERYLTTQMQESTTSRTGFNILNIMVSHGGTMRPSDISLLVFRSKHTITRAIDALEKAGLVEREPLGEDRRVRKVTITRKGLDLISRTLPSMRQVSDIATSCLDKQHVVQLNGILKRIGKDLLRRMGVHPQDNRE